MDLSLHARALGHDVVVADGAADALARAFALAAPGDLVCVVGTSRLMGKVCAAWERMNP